MYENIAVADINKAVNGIELSFSTKPPYEVLRDLKENGFRWHNKKQIWYGRNSVDNVRAVEKYVDIAASNVSFGVTPEGTVDILQLRRDREGKQNDSRPNRTQITPAQPEAEKPTCIADVYDSVGGTKIYRDSTIEGSLWSSIGSKGYYADINAYVWCNYNSAIVIELDNAMKRGKECKRYSLYSRSQDSHCYLVNDCKVNSPKELYDLVRSGKEMPGDGELSVSTEKGVEVFSPFVSVKPLDKLPEKWKKSDLAKAIMAGQVFSAVLDQRLTDDYAYDAAVNFGSGRKLDLPGQAADLIEGCRDCYIRTDGVDENGVASVHFSYAGDMKTFLFDVTCNLPESIIRQNKAQEELEAHNALVKSSVKKYDESDIESSKIYVIDKIVEDSNTGKLRVAPELVQGFKVLDYLEYEEITGIKEAEFIPNKLYEVAGFFQRRDYAEDNPRIVDVGNWGQICSGKAIEELTREGVSLNLSMGSYEKPITFEAAKKDCMNFISGRSSFMFGNKVDYSESLKKLEAEEVRLAKDKTAKKELSSLADIIGFAEVKREFEKNQRSTMVTEKERDPSFDR